MQGANDGYPNPPNTKTIDITSAISGNPSNTQIRFHYYNGTYEWWWAIDNVRIECAVPVCNVCNVTTQIPGRVLNNLTIAKSGNNLLLNWTPPGGTCIVTGYGVYRGTLPLSAYNHASLSCTASAPYSTPQDTGSYYFLVVPQNSTNEGSYGLDSSSAQIPAASSPCHPQDLTACN
ncbi:MAG: hypothetical protein A2Y62_11735 [Candidatus Fischerbacteria bacterium RBG_13_37_8]|uniref:Fibronectin type-III domain-containing protein n=1 Tax=Candidatus Fischerbacteria bacterium RBG_13_37_8 TaxID=1817863 RepID=A0A1F5VGP1_9BACT|nr:MAG: hypothetical protein A2Y62_11735 [Candidatus Fischerbacteria bacterium RBG_13_37_8]